MIWLPFLSVRTFGNWLTNFVNELSFELLVHILLYEDQDKIMIIHSNQYSFPIISFLPLMLEKLIHQSDNRTEISQTIGSSRYFIIEGESYPTYILNRLWGPIIVPFGGQIETYTPHLQNSYMRILGHQQKPTT